MPATENAEKSGYAAAQAEVTEHLMEQLRLWRSKLTAAPITTQSIEDVDRLFAAQMAARLLELSLRPAAVHDLNEIRPMVCPFREQGFETDITLEDVVTMIAETGAVLRGHFVLLSELHSDYFFMFSRLGRRVEFRKRLATELAKRFASAGIESVVAPVTAGGLLVQDVASELKAKFAFFDVDDHSRPCAIRRGYSVRGATLIVNDMTTTGEGIERMSKVVTEAGARFAGVGLIATRGAIGTQIVENFLGKGCKVEALFHLATDAVRDFSCEKCRMGLPFIRSADVNR